ncbi:MAG: O-antigen ligase family protein, partial [Acidobacteria bacterium]|nr:O-antigen ligase family protein [Acidobacteriota bacterium]
MSPKDTLRESPEEARAGGRGRAAADSRAGSDDASGGRAADSRFARGAHAAALGGLALYAFFAPGSIAAAWIAISIAAAGWLARTLVSRRAGLRRTALDLPLWSLFGWTVLSSFFSAEPDISLRKLPSAAAFLFFYVAQAVPRTRREVTWVARALVAGACVCTLWGVGDLIRGRGVVVEEIAAGSVLGETAMRGATRLRPGDSVWRVNGRRVDSIAEIDAAVRAADAGSRLRLSVITRGEHIEWDGPFVTEAVKSAASPTGLRGTRRTHNFRASGWTRHYETFAETLQIAAQLALGFALAHLARRGTAPGRRRALLFFAAFGLLACGIALTAMRTTLVAFSLGALVAAWRATAARARPLPTQDQADGVGRGTAGGGARPSLSTNRTRAAVMLTIAVVLSLGAFAVWRTRSAGALKLRDDSSRLRLEVARVAAGRVPERPLFGHGMDAQRRHWAEWGFPGEDALHMHSTPLQLAFDRGLPALALWLWLLAAFWLTLTRAERLSRESADA